MHYFEEDSTIGRSLSVYGEWAEYELEFISRLVRPGGVILDVGANIGCHSVAFSRMVGPSGKVYSFEPFADNFTLLKLNTINLPNIAAMQAMVGTAKKVVITNLDQLFAPGLNFGAISFSEVEEISGPELVNASLMIVPQVALDTFSHVPVDVVKIDVEGMELDVLFGARRLLATRKPIIYFEQNSFKNFSPIASLLSAFGYRLFWHTCYPYNRSNFLGSRENIFGNATELNVLAVHSSDFNSRVGLLDLIKQDVVEANSANFDPPLPHDPAPGRAVKVWEEECPVA